MMKTSKCRGCTAEIIWAKTSRGKNMPVDAKIDGLGAWLLETHDDGQVYAVRLAPWAPGQARNEAHTSHFDTCPKREQFRKN